MEHQLSKVYLGWYISDESVSDCSYKTVTMRKGKVVNSILQIKAIVEDARCGRIGALETGLSLWETSLIPFLLHSSENWLNLSSKTLKILSDLQNDFFRSIFSLPLSTPIPIMYLDTKTPLMTNRIWKQKILFLFHLENLPALSMGSEVLTLQKNLHLPGLHKECEEVISKLGLADFKKYTKAQFKKVLNAKLEEKNFVDLINMTKSYKKLDSKELAEEVYCVKQYIKKPSFGQIKVNDTT